MLRRAACIACGCALDALVGDPEGLPHLVRLIGHLVSRTETALRARTSPTPRAERAAGIALVGIVCGTTCVATHATLALLRRHSPLRGLVAETLVCHQMVACRQLAREATKVGRALEGEGLDAARRAVSMIVGRDTAALDEAGVVRATVETVAENASDGVVAPLLFLALAGPTGGVLHKAVSTMDSMVGYRNERYLHFGWAAARADDLCAWVPARLTAAAMCLAAPLVGLSGKGAWRILVRDGDRHASPNAGRPEAACAGALGVRLAGPASYFGELHDKPWIGDNTRDIERADIRRSIRLLDATAALTLALLLPVAYLRGR